VDTAPFDSFADHPIHQVLRVCAGLRPSVDIFVQ
jgi:ketol-acid reductoisomerase